MKLTFDYDKALTIVDGDVDLLKELIDLFNEQSKELLKNIEQAIEAGDAERLRNAAHTIRGALGNVGGVAAHEIGSELEQMGDQGDLKNAHEVFTRLRTEVSAFVNETATSERLMMK
ncbi:MAG: hypothetical protein DRP45_01865 [Candidatus Zixiibacteriota bacterium]|nr:MAG: hypothetical protein DRP45_01865 [candidate division Zixibacteria bacterium]